MSAPTALAQSSALLARRLPHLPTPVQQRLAADAHLVAHGVRTACMCEYARRLTATQLSAALSGDWLCSHCSSGSSAGSMCASSSAVCVVDTGQACLLLNETACRARLALMPPALDCCVDGVVQSSANSSSVRAHFRTTYILVCPATAQPRVRTPENACSLLFTFSLHLSLLSSAHSAPLPSRRTRSTS